MDFKHNLDFKTYKYAQYNSIENSKYDYAKHGILNKCLPKIFFRSNPLLTTFLQLIDLRIVLLLKYVDKLKRFKYITWY